MHRRVSLLLAVVLTLGLLTAAVPSAAALAAQGEDFSDVPKGHWAYDYIVTLRGLGITDGVGGNRFGVGRPVTRAEFVAFLCKLMKWEPVTPDKAAFTDTGAAAWYFSAVETALKHGVVTTGTGTFRPESPIVREDMAVMLVRTLGYGTLAGTLSGLNAPFSDVKANIGYIYVAKSLGLIDGVGGGAFAPAMTATREQAAAILIRMVRLLDNKLSFLNGFYAIQSAGQMAAVPDMDAVCYGWARLELADGRVSLNTTGAGGNEYRVPQGYDEPYEAAAGQKRLLFVAVSDEEAAAVISSETLRGAAVKAMADAVVKGFAAGGQTLSFDGVVADFEGFKGAQKKSGYTAFLTALRKQLPGKLLYVAVPPARRPGQAYFDGYDFRAIGRLADRVLLMAHDYSPKALTASDMDRGVVMTPVAPLGEVFYALAAVTDPKTGVEDRSKVLLQINFATAQWKLKEGKVQNSAPYTPGYDAVVARLRGGADRKYSDSYESPYITFKNETDQTDNVVWYENARSVTAKMKLARYFGVGGLSLWRLGTIPDDGPDIEMDVLTKLLAQRGA